jgi:large subunit ribosomal protein L7/L12
MEQIVDQLSKLTVIEIVELASKLEKKWNVSLIQNNTPTIKSDDNIQKKKSVFDIILKEVGGKRIKIISLVKEITGLGLKESKNKIDSIPVVIKKSVPVEQAQKVKEKMESEGAKIDLK